MAETVDYTKTYTRQDAPTYESVLDKALEFGDRHQYVSCAIHGKIETDGVWVVDMLARKSKSRGEA